MTSRRKRNDLDQPWLPGTWRCQWQEAAGKHWHPAVAVRDLGDTFLEVDVADLGRRIGTTDRKRDYPGYIKPMPRRRGTGR